MYISHVITNHTLRTGLPPPPFPPSPTPPRSGATYTTTRLMRCVNTPGGGEVLQAPTQSVTEPPRRSYLGRKRAWGETEANPHHTPQKTADPKAETRRRKQMDGNKK